MPDLLLELFSEEIPARFQKTAAGNLRKAVTDALVDAGLTYEGAKEYWTPRRLVLDLRGLDARSKDIREERKGPRTDAPQKAIDGFLRGAGLASIDEAQVANDPKKGEFYIAVIEKPGRDAAQIIAEIMPPIIRNFPWPKSMRWGAASAISGSLTWVRPLQSILCTFGPETEEPEIVNFEVEGIASSNVTRGHRFMAPGEITVKRFDDYVQSLEKAKVILDAERRMEMIRTDAENLSFAQGFEVIEDKALLAEVSGLVEWPCVLMGEYEEDFLDIPARVIQLTIRENQKCFVLKSRETGELVNRFLLVSNIVPSDGGAEVARGNAKVVNARLSDAKFFWESDLQQINSDESFDPWIEKLNAVTFHAKLGTQGERVQRIVALAEELAPIVGADVEKAKRAAQLCKADLNSAMVYEFPEVQGFIGKVYAEKSGKDASVAKALEDHYKPLGPTDDVPTDPVAVTVALADKLDMLVGFWAINEKPTGSKDPYALRRAALGVIRLVLENGVRIDLADSVEFAYRRLIISLIIEYDVYWENTPDCFVLLGKTLNGNKGRFGPIVFLGSYRKQRGIVSSLTDDGDDKLVGNLDYSQISKFVDFKFLLPTMEEIELNLLSFFHDRLKVYLKEQGIRHDVLDAVLAPVPTSPLEGEDVAKRQEGGTASNKEISPPSALSGISPSRGEINQADDLLQISQKASALQKLVDTDDGENLIQGYKRASNILAAEEKKGAKLPDAIDPKLLEGDEERALFETLGDVEQLAATAIKASDFETAMARLATLRAPIDNFFENVHVNADDDKVRLNRLALLSRIRAATSTVADLSKISG